MLSKKLCFEEEAEIEGDGSADGSEDVEDAEVEDESVDESLGKDVHQCSACPMSARRDGIRY